VAPPSKGGIGREQTDAKRRDRIDSRSQIALVLGRTDQSLGIVDRAQQQVHLLVREACEGSSGSRMVGIGAVKRGPPTTFTKPARI
jgi:hypothetical protein